MAIKKFGEWCQQFDETGLPTSASAAIKDYRATSSELGTAGTGGLNVLMAAFQALKKEDLQLIVNKMYTLLDHRPDIQGKLKPSYKKYTGNRPTDESPE
jgi:hypothetical protein